MYPPSQRVPFPPVQSSALPPPPGLAGEIARHIFNTSVRPVPEVAIVVALGLVAGICGKAYLINQYGLNVRIIFISPRDFIEDDLKDGVTNIIRAVASSYPEITQFVDFHNYPNSKTLNEALVSNPCFVNVVGEFGPKLVSLTTSLSGRMVSLREAMDNPDKITPSGYSLIGKTTTNWLLEKATTAVLENDFLHSFTMVEYTGDLPQENEHWERQLPQELRDRVIKLCQLATGNVAGHQRIPVQVDHEAKRFLDAFNRHCDAEINGTENDVLRRILDRAHEKVLRLAALLAVADNCTLPIIGIAHATWAQDLVLRNVAIMSRHIDGAGPTGKKRMHR
jgi:hypothetical protein